MKHVSRQITTNPSGNTGFNTRFRHTFLDINNNNSCCKNLNNEFHKMNLFYLALCIYFIYYINNGSKTELELVLITLTRLNLINCKIFAILHHPYCCYVYIPCTTCLHIHFAHPCLYYYLLSPQYTVLHIVFYSTFYSYFFLFFAYIYVYIYIYPLVLCYIFCNVH